MRPLLLFLSCCLLLFKGTIAPFMRSTAGSGYVQHSGHSRPHTKAPSLNEVHSDTEVWSYYIGDEETDNDDDDDPVLLKKHTVAASLCYTSENPAHPVRGPCGSGYSSTPAALFSKAAPLYLLQGVLRI